MFSSPGASAGPDGAGFDQAVERWRSVVTRICRKRLSGLPAADIEDAVQDTFVQLAEADGPPIRNVEAWLTTVAGRVCARVLRRRYRAPSVPLSDALPSDATEVAFHHVDETLWLAKFAALLPTTDAQILHMLYVQDMTYGDIARYFATTSGNARVLAYRARQHARGVIHHLD